MPYGYNNRNSYRGSTGYRPSDRRRDKKKKINFRRVRNRAIIIGAGLLILALIFFMLTKFFSCVCGSSNGNGSTLDTSTVRTKETTAPSEDNKTWNFKTANIRDTDKKSKGVSEAVSDVVDDNNGRVDDNDGIIGNDDKENTND